MLYIRRHNIILYSLRIVVHYATTTQNIARNIDSGISKSKSFAELKHRLSFNPVFLTAFKYKVITGTYGYEDRVRVLRLDRNNNTAILARAKEVVVNVARGMYAN